LAIKLPLEAHPDTEVILVSRYRYLKEAKVL